MLRTGGDQMRDDLPADLYVDLLLYDDRDPSQVIAHAALGHRHDDPPGQIMPVEPTTIAGLIGDPVFRKKLIGNDAPSLRALRGRGTEPAARMFLRGLDFAIPLGPWLSLDPDHTRAARGAMVLYRYELFTEEHHRIMNA